MLKTLKQSLLRASRGVGLLEVVSGSEWRRRRLLILCYHSLAVDQEHEWRRPLFFTAEEFEARLERMRRSRLNVLPLEEALTRLRAGTLPHRSAALTFDDGSADFASIAVPLLQKFGYPATVYVTTYYLEKRLPIFSLMVSYLLWKGRTRRIEAVPELGLEGAVDLTQRSQRRQAEAAIVAAADRDRLTAEQREANSGRLAGLLGVDYAEIRRRRVLELMTPAEVSSVAAAGFDVQLHSHRHRVPRVRAEFDREIAENRSRIQAMTGRAARHFCYPRGVHFPEFLPWLADLDVASATTCVPSLATSTSDLLALPRLVDTAGLSEIEFDGWLSGASHVLPRRSDSEG